MKYGLYALFLLSVVMLGYQVISGGAAYIPNLAAVVAATDSSWQSCLQQISDTHGHTIDTSDAQVTRTKIDTDASTDYLIELTGDNFCGSAGCIFEICLARDTEAKHVPFGYAATSVEVTEGIENGMRDLVLNGQHTLRWSGESYLPLE
jgi:hypothetical protein